MRFEGKTVAITGGGGGIGSALVRRFAAEGASVRCIDIDAGRARAPAAPRGARPRPWSPTSRSRPTSSARSAGRVDVLVNNTLSATGDNLVTIDEESWRRDMDGTLTSAFLCIRAVLPGMIERGGGAIVNVASVNGLGYYGNEAYSAAKAGLINLTGSVAARYGRHGVRANAVAPGTIRTAGLGRAPGARARPARAARALVPARARRHAGRGGVRACSSWPRDEASFVTGAVLDGRRRAHDRPGADGRRAARREPRRGGLSVLDLCFRGARVVDGAGNPWYRADVGVRGDRIVARRPRRRARAAHARVRRARAHARVHRHAHAFRRAAARAPRPRLQGAPGRDARGARAGRAGARADRRRDDGAAARAARRAGTAPSPSSTTAGAAWPSTSRASRARPPSTSATSSPTPRCGCSPSAPTTAPPRRPSSTRCARSCARASPRAPSGSRPASPTRPGMYASDDELVALCGELTRRRLLLPAPPQLRPARDQGLRGLDRDRAPRGRAAAPRARPPRLRLQPRARAASCSR